MSDFRFANPEWSILLWVVLAIVILLVWLESRRGNILSRFISSVMQKSLVSRPSAWRRWAVIAIFGLSAICVVIALMRPQYGLKYIKSSRVGAQIMFCLDVSKSMLAEDTAPNRLDRAKADIADLLTFLDGDQVGLIGFAGRATVLCPLTPDYGFFKLILESAGPNSVGRGGTRLEEPLRKALDGFRNESDVSRIVFLITDGEDHDSHPLDVAKEAIERGVKVVAVGLGDENGSEIRMTDPRTGVQSVVKDAEGNPVISRLDGETLRELSLATEGVFIPAGTGSLDLRSIYDVHIKPLVRGQMQTEGRAIRNDAFQWAILAGIVLFMIALLIGSGAAASTRATAVLAFAFLTLNTSPVVSAAENESVAVPANSTAEPEVIDPRDVYNRGLKEITANLDEAEKLLTEARQESGTDGEVRYRATYNMGWVEINRADAAIKEDPQKALSHLQQAAGWFRDSVRLRKDATDARHNLEVVLLRILRLRDQLAKKDERDLAAQLDALAESQRKTITQLQGLLQEVSSADDVNIVDQFRHQFQRLAVQQRVAMSDVQDVVEAASEELESLQKTPQEELTTEQKVRASSLMGVLNYLNEANQRISQSRSQLRRRQASRGFRRAASGLNALKRARDQLRGPVELLDVLLADTSTTAQQTALKLFENQTIDPSATSQVDIPAWIDQDFLVDSQLDLLQRTQELTSRLAAGLQQEAEGNDSDANKANDQQLAPEEQEFLSQIEEAMPFLQDAVVAMNSANEKLGLPEYDAASQQQLAAINAFQEAKERFANIRSLIELAFATENQIAGAVKELTSQNEEKKEFDPEPIKQIAIAAQLKNSDRMERLNALVQRELTKLRAQVDAIEDDQGGATALQKPDQPSPEIQRMNMASELVAKVIDQMKNVSAELEKPAVPPSSAEGDLKRDNDKRDNDSDSPDQKDELDETDEPDPTTQAESNALNVAVDETLLTLQELRRLFFSLVEHLKETAQRQSKLGDETELLAGIQAESNDANEIKQQTQPLASQQEQLAATATQIAQGLEEQGKAVPPSDEGNSDDPQANALQENAQKSLQAATLVKEASEKMELAFDKLNAETWDVKNVRPPQNDALKKLIEAIQVLEPPQENQDQNQNQQQDQQQNENQDQQQNENQDQQQSQDQQQTGDDENEQANEDEKMDPSRVLQAVRDREAQRRKDKEKRQRASQVPVDKDW